MSSSSHSGPERPQERAVWLRERIEYHNHRYYALDDPEIGDDAYDDLLEQLRELERKHPELRDLASPTQRVGVAAVSALVKVEHAEPMLSLPNARSAEDLRAWVGRIGTHLAREGIDEPAFDYVIEPKVDGLAIALTYRDGLLLRGATRGDGRVGEDVTHNLRTIDSIPQRLRGVSGELEIRGEVYMSLSDFTALNERRAAEGASTFMNPRNAAAGTIRQLDPKLAAQRPLSFWAYQVVDGGRLGLVSQTQALQWLEQAGLPVNPDIVTLADLEAVIERCQEWERRRGSLDFEIDGAVVKVSELAMQQRLGAVGRDPRWAIAWKFAPTTALTMLQAVQWNVGRSGDLHPYAELEAVRVGGVTIRQATLHNEEDLARKDIRPGEQVIVVRAGDVIPQVISPAPHVAERAERPPLPRPPAHCPFCGTKTLKEPGRVFTRCPNRACPERHRQILKHFVSRAALDIEGLGEKQVALLMERGMVSSPADIFRLQAGQLQALEGFGEVSAAKLLTAIEQAKLRPFARVLVALGIGEVGEVTARALAQRFGDIDRLLAATVKQIAEVSGIGEKMATAIHDALQEPQLRELIDDLKGLGLIMHQSNAGAVDGPLTGKSIVLTGTLPQLTREAAAQLIEASGGRVVSAVSARTDLVVAGTSAGSKLAKAERLGVTVIDEAELLALLDQ